jgi:metal-sulfur cluster biosynthetic enzyme
LTRPHPPDREALLEALDDVHDPCCADRGLSIVDMGIVEGVHIDGSHVRIDLVPTTGWCPFVATMGSAIPERLRQVPGVTGVDVQVVWDPVWTMDRLSDAARHELVLPLEDLEPHRERRLAADREA